MVSLTAVFTLPAGSTAYAFYPGGFRDGAASNDVWTASGIIKCITLDSEALAAPGFEVHVHDYFDTTTFAIQRGGSTGAAGLITVAGIGVVQSNANGGMDCFSTNVPAAIVAGNRKFTIKSNFATIYPYQVNTTCPNGMVVAFSGGAVTTAIHKVSIEYEPYKLGGQRKTQYANRGSVNAGPVGAF